ncbi:MAG: hypothetical protein VXY51_10235 [Pseudomonadota bacterium]|nr:hypothetical protein [Pseudomonadota bacterium]MEC8550231.1 hypothetical protein [Pseudomonadota bacterium]MEC8550356.1 hypothetical protein [Pseudomonadota bacterium]
MAKQIKLIQERPNTGVAWFDAADDFKNLKVTYVNAGKLDDKGVAMSNGDLVRTWTLEFTTAEDYDAFCAESAQSTYWTNLMSYNVSNSISHSLEANDI